MSRRLRSKTDKNIIEDANEGMKIHLAALANSLSSLGCRLSAAVDADSRVASVVRKIFQIRFVSRSLSMAMAR